jgi:3-hydroxyacyl-CoA dehydrogenase
MAARIGFVGATGLMGHGIAQVFARAGSRVRVYDAFPASLDSLHARIESNLRDLEDPVDCLSLVSGHADLGEALLGAAFVFECAPEKLEIKQAIFADLERLAPPDAVLASNTSVMPIGSIVGGMRTPLVAAQLGALLKLPELPAHIDAATTARYTHAVLNGELPVPAPLAAQVQAVLKALAL